MCKSLWVSKNDGVSCLCPLISTTTSKSYRSPFWSTWSLYLYKSVETILDLISCSLLMLTDDLYNIVSNVGFAIGEAPLLKESDFRKKN